MNSFSNAYKKERYLDMKIYSLPGFSNFVEEQEITKPNDYPSALEKTYILL